MLSGEPERPRCTNHEHACPAADVEHNNMSKENTFRALAPKPGKQSTDAEPGSIQPDQARCVVAGSSETPTTEGRGKNTALALRLPVRAFDTFISRLLAALLFELRTTPAPGLLLQPPARRARGLAASSLRFISLHRAPTQREYA